MSLLTAPLHALLGLALPARCPACGTVVGTDGTFCPDCWVQLDFLSEPGCAGCGLPFAFDRGPDVRCAACLADPPAHDGVRAAVRYGAVARSLVLRLKHGRRIALARVIARQLRRLAADLPGALIVPVPLHRWRLWRRGFNQSALIGRALARATGLDWCPHALVRQRRTPMLGGLGRTARARALRGAFAVPSEQHAALAGRTILLVDDVYTSGATAGGCARALKRAGAARVIVLCWARVLDPELDGERVFGNGRNGGEKSRGEG